MRSKYSIEELAEAKKFWVKDLKVLAKANENKLKELSKLFVIHGRINSRARAQGLAGGFFAFIADFSDIDAARYDIWNPYYEAPDWERMDEIHNALYRGLGAYRGPGYRDEFKALKLLALDETRCNDDILARLELAAERYLRHLEIMQECLSKWVEVFDKQDEEEGINPHAQSGLLEHFIQGLQNEIDDFFKHLDHCYQYFSEKFLEEPLPEESLEDILADLQDRYTAGYKSMNILWRLIKPFFQQSEREQEIEFLAKLSQTEGCTDAIRMRAVALLHNKIYDKETFGLASIFGSGSKLRQILADIFDQKENSVAMSEEEEFCSFINEHNLTMPPQLTAYYETVTRQTLTI